METILTLLVPMTVIAIDSEAGSDGDMIAATVATRLGLNLVDEACLFERLRGRGVHVPQAFLSADYFALEDHQIESCRSLGTKLHVELLRLAQQDQILIHWPCATYLLADIGHVLRIKVGAPLSVRVRRHAARCGCNEQEARRRIEQDEGKTRFILSACFGIQARADAHIYSLVADTGWLAAGDWADEIVDLARDTDFVPTSASQAMLRWLLLQLPQEPDAPVPRCCNEPTQC
jgi:cytidylate kinase